MIKDVKMYTFKYSSKTFCSNALIYLSTFLFKSCQFIYLHYLLQSFSFSSSGNAGKLFSFSGDMLHIYCDNL